MHGTRSSRLSTAQALAGNAIALIGIVVAAALGAGCDSSATVTSGPSPVKCQLSLASSLGPLDASGGAGNISVATQPECTWSASSEVNWISGVSPTSGQGSAEVNFRIAANPLAAMRQGDLLINQDRVRVLQAASPCRFGISPRSQEVSAAGGRGTVSVTAASGCLWTATSQATWLSLTPPSSGDGNGALGFSAGPHSGAARSVTVSVGDQTFIVTQAPARETCGYAIDPESRSIEAAGTAAMSVRVSTTEGCSWTSSSNASWMVITAGTSANGDGSVTLSVSANAGSGRIGTVTIAGRTLTVSQAAANCTATLSPTTLSVPAVGGVGLSVAVSTGSNCAWAASSSASWLTFTSGANGTGNGTVTFSVAPNGGGTRTGTLTIAGHAFTVTQQAVTPCVYVITPASQSFDDKKGDGVIGVTTTPNCAWTATSHNGWIEVTSGASGTGSGTVRFRVDKNNNDDDRRGALTVAGQTFTVNQEGD